MASQPPFSPDHIEPQSPPETPADPTPTEQPAPQNPDATPDGGDIDQPGRGPDEVPPQVSH
jgi:fused signal recognition particle receptor